MESLGTRLTDLLAEQVRSRPDDVAVECGKEILTYRELADGADGLAVCLRGLGVRPDDCVGVFLYPSVSLPLSTWGVLSAGGAYLPLSPDYPDERLRYMVEDSRTSVILTEEPLRERLAGIVPPGTRIVTPADAARYAGEAPEAATGPGDLAYVIYTSGSTGRPKGVMIEHRSVVHQLRWLAGEYGLGPDTTVLQKTPMSFDAAQWELLANACGSRIVMGEPGVYRDPEGLIDTIVRHRVTALQCVPTLLQAIVETDRLHECSSLTQVFCGGEALPRVLSAKFLEILPGCQLVNLYGPTECTINSSTHTVDPAELALLPDGPKAVAIGTPVDGLAFHVLDADRAPVPPGGTGELYISGVQVSRGYLHRPDLTTERFTPNPYSADPGHADPDHAVLYRTGDLAFQDADGRYHFAGRVDRQVKLRGYRVELDEIRLAIESHDWVKNAAVLVKDDPATGYQNLIACIELSPREAALMDQGAHGSHHVSKASRLQVRAQLSADGCRDADDLAGRPTVELPGQAPTTEQRRRVFERKTYRFYEGGEVRHADLAELLERRTEGAGYRCPDTLSLDELGETLRWFGQFPSEERLLPKYGYASPGSLYATQLYVETGGTVGLAAGYYYYHPLHHQLVLISERAEPHEGGTRFHFVGRRRAIASVYRNNLQEVLEIEAGHMVGMLESVLPGHGLDVVQGPYDPTAIKQLDCAEEDYYLGVFDLVPYRYRGEKPDVPVDVYVQVHAGGVDDLAEGQYRYLDGALERISDDLVLKRHVIAINQQVYERAALGITLVSTTDEEWRSYLDLGRKLQHLQMNDSRFGFMASGYSSKTGHDLPAAKRMAEVLAATGHWTGPSYFFVGGRVSEEQLAHEGMYEDTVHMQGPAEMIKADLVSLLPDYMVPNRVVVMDRLPLTANGKIDIKALEASPETDVSPADRPFVNPRTTTERRIRELWKAAMKQQTVSVDDDFFESGGNSLIAVGLVNRLNREFGWSLPLQVIFETPTIEGLARRIDGERAGTPSSRLVPLGAATAGRPVHCWPGLGGYPMNLRLLARRLDNGRPFYGVQAHGINEGETPYATIEEMAEADVRAIREIQPEGPYTLWGYSFGARVAFTTAALLEQAGQTVDQLLLIAPGMPTLRASAAGASGRASFADPAYVTILFSVFAGTVTGPGLDECLSVAVDEESFVAHLVERYDGLDEALVTRVIAIVRQTYELTYNFHELRTRRVLAPVTVVKAAHDDYSFIENSTGYSAEPPLLVGLDADHYGMLRDPDVDALVGAIRQSLGEGRRLNTPVSGEQVTAVPHVNIKYFPTVISDEQGARLVEALTKALQENLGCEEGAVSIALEPVDPADWQEKVYTPEIVDRRELLRKLPNY
ncbi:amino acid adenylation domain-containing protein [Kitasatospora sp. McL0602]|uniref:amino acid adenylation domain-containing protein n=1 Tax=Kitasatospora sp. McL0602 TaxID=3439530 RepID=UPI003F89483B